MCLPDLDVLCSDKAFPTVSGQYAVRFIPRENGLHYIQVLFDNYHIPDSPFRIMVGKVNAADAGKVTAYGDGLHTGTTGQSSRPNHGILLLR